MATMVRDEDKENPVHVHEGGEGVREKLILVPTSQSRSKQRKHKPDFMIPTDPLLGVLSCSLPFLLCPSPPPAKQSRSGSVGRATDRPKIRRIQRTEITHTETKGVVSFTMTNDATDAPTEPPLMAAASSSPPSLVMISYNDLIAFSKEDPNSILLENIGKAYGNEKDALGILAVTDLPKEYAAYRERLLPMARDVAMLDDKSEIICPGSKYQMGWSHGKEMFHGKPDSAKGSFYANPLLQGNDDGSDGVRDELRTAYPDFFFANAWPTTALPGFEQAFLDLSLLVMRVGALLAAPCDVYVQRQCSSYPDGKLESVVKGSKFCKARLLHYFAVQSDTDGDVGKAGGGTTRQNTDNDKDESFDDWCGFHNDHVSANHK